MTYPNLYVDFARCRVILTETNTPDLEALRITGQLIPFRAPHYTTSSAGVRDELRRAVGGVLYLSDFGEWRRDCITLLAGALNGSAGPMPRAIVIDVCNPFRIDGPEHNPTAYRQYEDRVRRMLDLLGVCAVCGTTGHDDRVEAEWDGAKVRVCQECYAYETGANA